MKMKDLVKRSLAFACAVAVLAGGMLTSGFKVHASLGTTTVIGSEVSSDSYGFGVGKFTVSGVDGQSHRAYCACHELKGVPVGMTFTTEVCTNEAIRKILYYGKGGPGDVGYDHTQTSLAISVANGHMDSDDTGESYGPIGKPVYNALITKPAPPEGFIAYYAKNGNALYQDLVYWAWGTGKLQLTKESANPEITGSNSCYSLEGAEYGVYKEQACTNKVATLKTDASGKTNTVELNNGTYYVKEISASTGYFIDGNVYSVEVKSGQTTSKTTSGNLKELPGNDPLAFSLVKIDKESGVSIPLGGAKGLSDAEFTVKYYNGYYNSIDSIPNTATRTWILKTKKVQNEYHASLGEQYLVSGSDELYMVDGFPVLPLGTITVEETKAPEGYKLENSYICSTEAGSKKVSGVYLTQITEEKKGQIFKLQGGNEYKYADQIKRGDFEISKKDDDGKNLANVTFKITSKTTGESHTFITDDNGYYSSASSFNKHTKDTNKGTAESGLWFGQYVDEVSKEVKTTAPDNNLGALPYDTYMVEELPCEANKGKTLVSFSVKISRDNYLVDMGTLVDQSVAIGTTAKSEESGNHYALAEDSVTIIDTVAYSGLTTGTEHKLHLTVMDKESGEALKDASGKEITVDKLFTPSTKNGSTEVEVTFDASKLSGKDIVMFEELSLKGTVIAEHKKLDSEEQTIHFPKIGTQAKDSETESHISCADEDITVVDQVSYTNLQPNKKVTITGTLMDKETKKEILDDEGNVITAATTFVPEKKDGTVELTFTFKGRSLAGKTAVCFEEAKRGDYVIAVEKNFENPDQTIQFPEIGTQAKDAETESHISCADEDITLIDTVAFSNVEPGVELTFTGTLMDKETKKEILDDEGNPITSTTTFVPEEAEGEVELTFTFKGSKLVGKTAVCFEEVTCGEYVIAFERDFENADQTIYFPKIGTQAKDQETGTKTCNADESITIVDKVAYSNMEPGKEITITGVLMDKDAKKELLDDEGNKITATTTFVPEKAEGEVELTFTFKGSTLDGKSAVCFEEATRDEHVIASEKDFENADQTVAIEKKPAIINAVQTGLHRYGRFYGALALGFGLAGFFFARRNRYKSEKKEEM